MLICCYVGTTVFAASKNAECTISENTEDMNIQYKFYSPTYPNAYIIEERSDIQTLSTNSAKATVFVEEKYSLNEDNKVITTESRLLSEDEVLKIGVDNFGDMETERINAQNETRTVKRDTNARGKLSIALYESHSVSGNSVSCSISANATWSGKTDLLNPSTTQAIGTDYMGVVWSGSFTCTSSSIRTTCVQSGYEPPVKNMCKSSANSGRVWEFSESWTEILPSGTGLIVSLKYIDLTLLLSKNTMTGSGNTAEVALEYIHTYDTVKGSVNINASPTGIGAGITLSGVSKQWSISCVVTGVPY